MLKARHGSVISLYEIAHVPTFQPLRELGQQRGGQAQRTVAGSGLAKPSLARFSRQHRKLAVSVFAIPHVNSACAGTSREALRLESVAEVVAAALVVENLRTGSREAGIGKHVHSRKVEG